MVENSSSYINGTVAENASLNECTAGDMESAWIDSLAIVLKCSLVSLGFASNWIIVWVLLQKDRNPVEVIQLNQSVGSSLDAIFCLPLYFLAKHFFKVKCRDTALFGT